MGKAWGGKRPGAGRPRKLKEPMPMGITLEWGDYQSLEKLAKKRECSMNELVRRAIKAYLASEKKGHT